MRTNKTITHQVGTVVHKYISRLQAISTQETTGIRPIFYRGNKKCCYPHKFIK